MVDTFTFLHEEQMMAEEVELSCLDLRYEHCRIRDAGAERRLIQSLLSYGIREPLQGVDPGGKKILLNGFKRYRCARKLGMGTVPFISIGSDEPCGILELLRLANARGLGMLEQARLIEELRKAHGMSSSDISELLEKSKAWVSVRVGFLKEISGCVQEKIFRGEFPAYSFMYTLRRFIRINYATRGEVDSFVRAVSGKKLSIRDIDLLAHGYFQGPSELREQIRNGNVGWCVTRLKEQFAAPANCSESERAMLRDLEILHKYVKRFIGRSRNSRFKTNSFFAQANLLAGGILSQLDPFSTSLRAFYDKTGKAECHIPPS